jgi:hypothetical protein
MFPLSKLLGLGIQGSCAHETQPTQIFTGTIVPPGSTQRLALCSLGKKGGNPLIMPQVAPYHLSYGTVRRLPGLEPETSDRPSRILQETYGDELVGDVFQLPSLRPGQPQL